MDEKLEEELSLLEYLSYDPYDSDEYMDYDMLEDENGDPKELNFE